ncbi:MAG: hypothetical protein EBZ67_15160, partial [Chitinophagia bacterium]|nr:hypothetical protein [Chitinophagia bacterium]
MKSTKAFLLACIRVFVNLYYLGPWRNWFIQLAEYRHKGRVLPVAASGVIKGLEGGDLLRRLRSEGFSGTFRVDPEVADEILSHLEGEHRYIVPEPHITDMAVQKVVYDPGLQSLLRQYFGTCPHLYSTSIFITNPGGMSHNPDRVSCTKDFHYDLPDFKGLTLFVYLNDVDGFGGAHAVIPGTAARLTLNRLFSRFMSHTDALKKYGRDSIVTITGPKGTAFLEDLVNWHKRSVSNSPRYALAATF